MTTFSALAAELRSLTAAIQAFRLEPQHTEIADAGLPLSAQAYSSFSAYRNLILTNTLARESARP